MWKKHAVVVWALFTMVATLASFALPATADDDDPPTRVARLAYTQGSISFQPAGTDDWVTPGLNRPMTTGDKLWADDNGRVELQLDGSLIRLSNNTGFSFLNLSDNVTQIQLTAGTFLVHVRRLDDSETYEIDTPNLAFSVLRPGIYRISVNEAGNSTAIKVRSGQGEVTGGGAAYTVHANDSYTFAGTGQLNVNPENYGGDDQFDAWAASRDRRWENSGSARYVSADVVGYDDLDDHGSWRQTSDYGNVWFPRTSVPDWAPYHYGHWDYIEPWGYTWVDDEPWGFAPFHYGRWVNYQGAWGWVPARPRAEGVAYMRPVYAPALVAWVGGGATVAWFALGPREVYVPSYPVSRNYVNNVNVSNTTVNTTVVNNYYNTTIVNKNASVTNVKYVNQSVPGAVAATTPQAFTAAQPVARNAVKVDQRTVASAPVRAFTPAVAPAKQAVLGTGTAAAKPPAAIQTRAVVAKVVPPPPPPSFEARQTAIQSNGGKPLSATQVRQIQPATTHQQAAVKIAPPAKPAAPQSSQANRPSQPQNAQAAQNSARPPDHAADRPAPPPTNVKPVPNKPPTPNPAPPPNHPADRPPDRPADRPVSPNNAPQPPPANRPAPPTTNVKPEPNKPATPNPVPPPNRPADRPPDRPADRPVSPSNASQPPKANRLVTDAPVHPGEMPAAPRPTVQPSGNPRLDHKHQQEQEQLHSQQQQERQRLQQQQEQEHAKVAQQQADQAKKQQLEQQHQQQTQQLQQKHAEDQKQLQQKQQQERQTQTQSKPPKTDRPPQPKP